MKHIVVYRTFQLVRIVRRDCPWSPSARHPNSGAHATNDDRQRVWCDDAPTTARQIGGGWPGDRDGQQRRDERRGSSHAHDGWAAAGRVGSYGTGRIHASGPCPATVPDARSFYHTSSNGFLRHASESTDPVGSSPVSHRVRIYANPPSTATQLCTLLQLTSPRSCPNDQVSIRSSPGSTRVVLHAIESAQLSYPPALGHCTDSDATRGPTNNATRRPATDANGFC